MLTTTELKEVSVLKKIYDMKKMSILYQKNVSDNFTLLIILMVVFFIVLSFFIITYFFSKTDYTPTYVSDIVFDNKENADKIITEKKELSDLLNQENYDFGPVKNGVGDLKNYKKCKLGECVITIKTGLKKCPTSDQILIYDDSIEACTKPYSCDYNKLPYALNTDGSVNRKGRCSNYYNCPCVSDITCPDYITSTFEITNGNVYNIASNQNNYYLIQNLNEKFGTVNAVVDEVKSVCRINPDYTDRIINNKNTRYKRGDRFDCDNTWDFTKDSIAERYLSDRCDRNNYTTLSSYKTMLLFTQTENNVCFIGQMSYNVDTTLTNRPQGIVNARSFCQSTVVGFANYLKHPEYYTLSCTMGDGCTDVIIGVDFVDGDDNQLKIYRNMVDEKKKSFFPDYDPSAISNMFDCDLYQKRFNTTDIIAENLVGEIEVGDVVIQARNVTQTPMTEFYVVNKIDSSKITNETTLTLHMTPIIRNTDKTNSITLYGNGTIDKQTIIASSEEVIKNNIVETSTTLNGTSFNIYKPYGLNGLTYNTVSLLYKDETEKIKLDTRIYDAASLYSDDAKHFTTYPSFSQDPTLNTCPFCDSTKERADEFSFKNNKTMYYPVFNPSNYKQECVKCSPFLLAYVKLINTALKNIIVQFSSRDFSLYSKDFSRAWDYDTSLTPFLKDSTGQTNIYNPFIFSQAFKLKPGSTFRKLFIVDEEFIYGVRLGDYIMIVHEDDVSPNSTWTWRTATNNLLDNTNKTFTPNDKVSSNQITDPSGVKPDTEFDYKSTTHVEYGKMYKDSTQTTLGYIHYTNCQVVKMNFVSNIIETNAFTNTIISDNNYKCYIVRPTEVLELAVGTPEAKRGGIVVVDSISDDRIVNIKVLHRGIRYDPTNLPEISISNYWTMNLAGQSKFSSRRNADGSVAPTSSGSGSGGGSGGSSGGSSGGGSGGSSGGGSGGSGGGGY